MNSTLKKILKPLASLYLTVPLLALSMLLVYAGTTVQKQMSVLDVQKQFFHSWFTWIPFDAVLRPFAESNNRAIPGGFWMVGGYTLIALFLINLLAAHTVRFKLKWKRSGIILIHLGLILLLTGEIFASLFSVESQMMIDQGQTVNYSYDLRHVELAVIGASAPDQDGVTVIDSSALKPGKVLRAASLPFDVQVDSYYPNSALLGPMQPSDQAVQNATAGANQPLKVLPEAKVSGTEGSQVDQASAFITLRAGDKDLGTYLVSQSPFAHPEQVEVNGKTYRLELRFRRYYKPYAITLLKFSHDRYIGTDVPRNFSSRVRLVDPSRHVDREVLIWMNHPLTYRGETFYQQSFLPGDHTTILQIAHNPFWWMPYAGLALGLVGMLAHFGMHLTGFLRRRRAALAPAPPTRLPSAGGKSSKRSHTEELVASSYTLQPQHNLMGWTFGILGAIVALLVVLGVVASPMPQEGGYNLGAFGRLPVMYGGRVMPLDSLARNSLKIISGRESFKDADGKSHPAIRWLADVIGDAPGAMSYKVIRIDYSEIITQLGLDPDQKFFSLTDLLAHKDTVQKQMNMAIQVPEKQRDLYQKRIVELAQHIEQYLEIQQASSLMLTPPAHEGEEWPALVGPDHRPTAGAAPFVSIIQQYHDRQPQAFNHAVTAYHAALQHKLPHTMTKVDYEAFFNHAEPFFISLWLYVLVFVLACCSWLGGRKAFWSAAMGVLLVTFAIHSFGLVSRIYLTGRGPVTNLYSSAVFIAWAAVLLSIVLEIIYRNGLGATMAAVVGFASLVIAHYLGNDGDTMKPVVAVLATNFWLWTHVPCVTLGYASTVLAGVLAITYVLLGVFTPFIDEPTGKSLTRMVYGIVCFAILFSFVGTILGGIWADYSWGRFWGWDPKENGAILIVIWNAIILHARWSGMVRQRGMMLLAIGGNIVTGWSWFGTNLLGIGLHSYGFMDGAATWLIAIWGVHAAIIGIGLLPQHLWRSFRPSKGDRVSATSAAVTR